MKINACLIIKDDSEYDSLVNAIKSIEKYVDGIYLTATNKPCTKIKALCSVNDNMHFSFFKWEDDFAKARNFNFSQAPQDSDYILWIDADDVFEGGENLKDVAQQAKDSGKDIIFFTYWYACTFDEQGNYVKTNISQMRERLLRPGVTTWKGRLHETPVPINGVREKYTQYPYDPKERPIVVIHTADDKSVEGKMDRNKRILELQLKEERENSSSDPRTLLYLMKIYAEEDDTTQWEKVLDYGAEYLEKSGWDEERATCHELMGQVYGHLNKLKESVDEFHLAISEWPHNPLLYIRLASAYYNLKNYRSTKHWLEVAGTLDIDKKFTSSTTNIHAMKVMFAELLIKLAYNVDKDTKRALEASKMLAEELPTEANKNQVEFLEDLNRLNDACRDTEHLVKYLEDIGQTDNVSQIIDLLPEAITKQPFAHKIRQRFTVPRKWKDNEICYYCSFGGKHFEEWDGNSLKKGIGGSETAVIELAKEWTKLGYKVTVYGDPKEKCEIDGVTYLPWYHFNKHDYFNIFIQWRSWQMTPFIKSRKTYVDLHDMYASIDIKPEHLRSVDKFMVKSKYHRELAPNIPDDKFLIISNGI